MRLSLTSPGRFMILELAWEFKSFTLCTSMAQVATRESSSTFWSRIRYEDKGVKGSLGKYSNTIWGKAIDSLWGILSIIGNFCSRSDSEKCSETSCHLWTNSVQTSWSRLRKSIIWTTKDCQSLPNLLKDYSMMSCTWAPKCKLTFFTWTKQEALSVASSLLKTEDSSSKNSRFPRRNHS